MTFLKLNDALTYYNKKYQLTRWLESKVLQKGFAWIEPSFMEDYDTFTAMHPRLKKEAMVKLVDKEGRVLVLRPDITTSIIKTLVPKWNGDNVAKLFYHATVFQSTSSGIEEQSQFGVEVLGENNLSVDIDMIELIAEMTKPYQERFILEISHEGFISGLLATLQLERTERQRLKTIIDRKNRYDMKRWIDQKNLPEEMTSLFTVLFDLQGDLKTIEQQLNRVALSEPIRDALATLKRIDETLRTSNTNLTVTYDLSMMSQYDYYEGLMIKGFLQGVTSPILSGGRYSTLKMGYDKQVSAIGFSIIMNELLQEGVSFDDV